ncbi:hypothetical protein [Streptomyces decoyicus]|uniref:hypothetical protein n=1 Tax=Streptomyces decoyicus TaxID=249567 RepID=UPI0039A52DB2
MRKDADYAEEERELIRERTQGGVQEKAEEGGCPGGVAPYGWRIAARRRGRVQPAGNSWPDEVLLATRIAAPYPDRPRGSRSNSCPQGSRQQQR